LIAGGTCGFMVFIYPGNHRPLMGKIILMFATKRNGGGGGKYFAYLNNSKIIYFRKA